MEVWTEHFAIFMVEWLILGLFVSTKKYRVPFILFFFSAPNSLKERERSRWQRFHLSIDIIIYVVYQNNTCRHLQLKVDLYSNGCLGNARSESNMKEIIQDIIIGNRHLRQKCRCSLLFKSCDIWNILLIAPLSYK